MTKPKHVSSTGQDLCSDSRRRRLDLEKKFEICKVLALGALPLGPHGGHMYHMNTFESPASEDDSCKVWLKSNHAFLQEVDEQLLFT